MLRAEEQENEYIIKQIAGNIVVQDAELPEYNSFNTTQLSVSQIEDMLAKSGWVPQK